MKKIILIIVALAVIAAASGVFLGEGPVKNKAMKLVDSQLEKKMPCNYKLGGIDVGIMRGVELKNLKLADEAGGEFLQVKSIRLTFGLSSLLHPDMPFSGVVIENGKAVVVRNADGHINIIDILSKMKSRETEKTSIPHITIKNLQTDWIDYKLSSNPKKESFVIKDASIYVGDNGEYKLSGINIKKGESLFAIRGKWNDTVGAPVNLSLRATPIDIKDIIGLARSAAGKKALPTLKLGGQGAVEVRVFGPRGKEQFEGSVTLASGSLGGLKLRRFSVNFSPLADGRMQIQDLAIRMENGGRLMANGDLQTSAPFDFEVKAELRRFPIEAFVGAVRRQSPITGSMDAAFSLKGKAKKQETIAGEGSFEIRDGLLIDTKERNGESTPYRLLAANFKVAEGFAEITEGRLDSDQIQMRMAGKVGLDHSLDLTGKCEVAKGMVRRGFFKRLASNLLPDGNFGYKFPVHIGGTFENPDVNVKTSKVLMNGVPDQIKDTGNKVEKFLKKVF